MRLSTAVLTLEIAVCGAGVAPFVLGVLDVIERSVLGSRAILGLCLRLHLEETSHVVVVLGLLCGGVLWAPLAFRALPRKRCDGRMSAALLAAVPLVGHLAFGLAWTRHLEPSRQRELEVTLAVGGLAVLAVPTLWLLRFAGLCGGCGCSVNGLVNTTADAYAAIASALVASTRAGMAGVLRAVEGETHERPRARGPASSTAA